MQSCVATLSSVSTNVLRLGTVSSSRRAPARSFCHLETLGWQTIHRNTSARCPVWEGQQTTRRLCSQPCPSRRGSHRNLVASTSSALSETAFVSEEEFTKQITENPVVVVDWMAKWCRKCIYLKPKLERMLRDEFPGVPLVFIDVNSVPGGLVYGQGIKKMPTIAVYQDGEKVTEHIAAETGSLAVDKIRQMIKGHIDSTKPKTGPFAWVQEVFKSQDQAE